MKILFSDNTIWGLVNFRQEVFKYFYNQGHEIVLVAPSDANTQMKTLVPDFVKFVPVQLERGGQNPLTDLQYFKQLYCIYRNEHPDYIFHYTIKPNIYGTLAARLLHIPNTAMIAGLGYAFSDKGIANTIARGLYKFSLHFANHVFVLNEDNKETIIRAKIADASKIILLKGGEGVNIEELKETEQLSEDTETIFLMVARVLYDKGYKEFVDAARTLKAKGIKAKFQLLGPIDESYPNAVSKNQIEADVASGAIEYLGFSSEPLVYVSRPGVVLVLASAYHEGFNRSLMEACALGKPVITSNIPGCRELVNDGHNGYLVPPKDSMALANAMERYVKLSYQEKIKMCHASRLWAEERCDIKYVIDEYEKVLTV